MVRRRISRILGTLLVVGATAFVGLTVTRGVNAQGATNDQNQTQNQTQNQNQNQNNVGMSQGALLQDEQNTIDIVKSFGPSVVAVNVEVQGQRVNPFQGQGQNIPPQFRQFIPQAPQGPQIQQSTGSGFVVDSDGQIITNFHVVRDALQQNGQGQPSGIDLQSGAKLTVVFPNSDKELPVKVVGANPDYDLALLQLSNPSDLPQGVQPIPLANSDGIQVGQKVIAIGNPFGFQSTVTRGIVSAVGRQLPSIGQVTIPMVQTDAAINPGNSGGPLLDSAGEAIGISTMIIPSVGANGQAGNIGIGFGVPASLIQETLPDLRKGGLIGLYAQTLDIQNKPRIGISVLSVSDFPDPVQQTLNMPDHGVVVMQVAPGGPAENAGLKGPTYQAQVNGQSFPAGGDIILSADGKDLQTAQDLQRIVLAKNAGDTVDLQVWNNGQTRQVSVTLEVVQQQQQNAGPGGNNGNGGANNGSNNNGSNNNGTNNNGTNNNGGTNNQ